MPTQQEIIDYYFGSKLDYQIYNGSVDDLSMHYGFWDATTKSHRDALANESRVVAAVAGIVEADKVADFGCGYGSTAVWLASNLGCHVHGITISQNQVDEARKLASKRKVSHLAEFSRMDFHRTGFAEATLDVVISIESIAHSSTKERVLKEAFRVLKPGGRLVVADGFFRKPKRDLTDRDREIAKACFEGVHVPPLPERRDFELWLSEAGFAQIQWDDKTQAILPTARRVNRLGRAMMPVAQLFSLIGLAALNPAHMRAFIEQYYAFRDGLGEYGIFRAAKPVSCGRIAQLSQRSIGTQRATFHPLLM